MFTYTNEDLIFNAENHTFEVMGVQRDSVTTMLKKSSMIDDRWFTEQGRDNGTRRHLLTELFDKGTLDDDSVDLIDVPYLEAWVDCLYQENIDIHEIEVQAYHPHYKYPGIIDRLCVVDGCPAIVDIKTGAYAPANSIQVALYMMMIKEWPTMKGYSVYLKDNGKNK